jgi:molecular chaperone GrpE
MNKGKEQNSDPIVDMQSEEKSSVEQSEATVQPAEKEQSQEKGAQLEQDSPPSAETGSSQLEIVDEEGNLLTVTAKDVVALLAEKAALADQFTRLCAEYDNYRKRTQKEKDSIRLDATGDTVAEFLPVVDNLERAAAFDGADTQSVADGLALTLKQAFEIFAKLGVKELGVKGETFNADIHNAVMHIEDDEQGENVVSEVFQKGYEIRGKVLRHATVQVAN